MRPGPIGYSRAEPWRRANGLTFVGVLEGATIVGSGRKLWTPPVLLALDPERGLVSARTPEDLLAGRFLVCGRGARPASQVLYFRDRRPDYDETRWFHDVSETRIDTDGAIDAPSAYRCPMKGDFICGG